MALALELPPIRDRRRSGTISPSLAAEPSTGNAAPSPQEKIRPKSLLLSFPKGIEQVLTCSSDISPESQIKKINWLDPSDWAARSRVYDEFENLRNLATDWNGYGAERIDPRIIQAARCLVDKLPTEALEVVKVVPMSRGRLQFEWHRGNRTLELEFETPTTIHYLQWDSDRSIEDEDVLSVSQVDEILRLLSWFASE